MDALGSLRGVVNPTGEVLEGQDYTPCGTPFRQTGTAQTSFGFTGEQTDPNGLLNLRARYYVPGLGVFPSLDPVEEGNRYGYVGGDVVNRVDPSGMVGERPERWTQCQENPECDCLRMPFEMMLSCFRRCLPSTAPSDYADKIKNATVFVSFGWNLQGSDCLNNWDNTKCFSLAGGLGTLTGTKTVWRTDHALSVAELQNMDWVEFTGVRGSRRFAPQMLREGTESKYGISVVELPGEHDVISIGLPLIDPIEPTTRLYDLFGDPVYFVYLRGNNNNLNDQFSIGKLSAAQYWSAIQVGIGALLCKASYSANAYILSVSAGEVGQGGDSGGGNFMVINGKLRFVGVHFGSSQFAGPPINGFGALYNDGGLSSCPS